MRAQSPRGTIAQLKKWAERRSKQWKDEKSRKSGKRTDGDRRLCADLTQWFLDSLPPPTELRLLEALPPMRALRR
jgi:hypothetical protein